MIRNPLQPPRARASVSALMETVARRAIGTGNSEINLHPEMWCRVHSVYFEVNTDGTVVDRVPLLSCFRGSTTLWELVTPAVIGATATVFVSMVAGIGGGGWEAGNVIMFALGTRLYVPPGAQLAVSLINGVAGDIILDPVALWSPVQGAGARPLRVV